MLNFKISRRNALKLGAITLATMALPLTANAQAATGAPFKLPELPYPADALQPVIGEETMKIHHGKHHKAYVDNLNRALEGKTKYQNWTLEDLLRKIDELPEEMRKAVRNHGGGHHNHTLFWESMTSPDKSEASKPDAHLAKAIQRDFGSLEEFKKQFQTAGAGVFGSGWVWLAADPKSGKLSIETTANQDSLLMTGKLIPLLGNDVWEHAYYLNYQNRRPDYLAAWWGVVNWDVISKRYHKAHG